MNNPCSAPLSLQRGPARTLRLQDTPFALSHDGEPHFIRRNEIIKRYPAVRELFGYDRRTIGVTVAVAVAQLGLAWELSQAARAGSWLGAKWMIVLVAYTLGAVLSHWLGQTIHEAAHNLAARRPLSNRLLAGLANLPMGVPIAETFRRYHIAHHTYLGVLGTDTDLPLNREVELIGSRPGRKLVWLFFYFFVYVARGWSFIKGVSRAEVLNALAQLGANVGIYYCMGWSGLGFLWLSTLLGHSLHPVAAHFIHEHYTFAQGQETNSYYGPLNLVTFNVGYHVEHHDFMNIPGWRLKNLTAMAPEYYAHLRSHRSWTWVLWHFVVKKTVGVGSRIVRSRQTYEENRRQLGRVMQAVQS